ncbi:MAG: metal ABC transporter ATP-binding protein [Planctomycetia bacterium]|nr:metal ABC transporter ATP-binding protein [Planctomycetia bacterium]
MIEFRNVCFSYVSETRLLDNVSFHVYRGEFAAIIGANGAGKSTLLKIALNLLHPDSGEVRLCGARASDFHEWWKVGYVPQSHPFLNTSFPATVEEMVLANLFQKIGLFRFPRREHRQAVCDALELAGLVDLRHALIGSLSGGQLQRVFIARALVNHPSMLVLDEPMNGIDATNARSLYELLARLQTDQNLTIAMVTHDVARAADYVQRIFCLEDANLVEIGHEQLHLELKNRHKHPHPHSSESMTKQK